MQSKWRELLPDSACIENLEYFREEILNARKSFVRPGDAWGAYPIAHYFASIKRIEEIVEEKEEFIGPQRVTRILFNNVPVIASMDDLHPPNHRRAHEWTGRVLDNVEQELKQISDARILWISVLSALVAVLSALVSAGAFLWDVAKTEFGCR